MDRFSQRLWLIRLKRALIDASESPALSGLLSDALTPVTDSGVFCLGAFPYTSLSFNDPMHFTLCSFLHRHPIGMIETDRAAWLEVIHTELRARISLLGRAQAGKA